MQNNIEVEVRGRLTDGAYEKFLNVLKKDGAYVETKKRVLLDYSTFLKEEGVRERTRDIRLRVTNGKPEIITKIGNWGGKENRRELSVMTEIGSFDTLVETYAVLGYTKAVLCIRNTEVFMYKDIEFALVEVPNHSYYFEAEISVSSEHEVEEAHAKIETVCAEFDVELFDTNGFHEYIEELNRDANETFDYASYEHGYFAKRFNLPTT